jgi:UDP-glucose 4-epimerase
VKFLITGGAGFIGSHLADMVVGRGDEVVILDDFSTGTRDNVEALEDRGSAEIVLGSTLDEQLVDDCMASVDACFHLASTVGVKLVVGQPLDSLLRDVRGVDIVAAAAHRHGRRLVFTSTSEIYGKRSDGYVSESEDRLLGPTTISRWNYSTAKAFGEAVAHGYHRERDAETIVARMFNTVGPRQSAAYGMVLPRFVSQALARDDLTVYGDGTQGRCFCHVADAVEALVGLVASDDAVGGTFNVGCADAVRIVDLARAVVDRSESGSRIRFVPYDDAYADGFEELGCRTPDTSRLRRVTGWTPSRTIEDAIDDTIVHQRAVKTQQAVA